MGNCSPKEKRANPEDPPYGVRDAVMNGKMETDGGVTLNINATNVTIGRRSEIITENENPPEDLSHPEHLNTNQDAAKVMSQPLKEVYTPADENGACQLLIGHSKTSKQELLIRNDEMKFGKVKSTDTDNEDEENGKDAVKVLNQPLQDVYTHSDGSGACQLFTGRSKTSTQDSLEQDCPLKKDLNNFIDESATTHQNGSLNSNCGIDTIGNRHIAQQKHNGTSKAGICKVGHTSTFSVISDENHFTDDSSERRHLLRGNITEATSVSRNTTSNCEERSMENPNASSTRLKDQETNSSNSLSRNVHEQSGITTGSLDVDGTSGLLQSNNQPDAEVETQTPSNTLLKVVDGLSVNHDIEVDAERMDTEIVIQDEETETSIEKNGDDKEITKVRLDIVKGCANNISELCPNAMQNNLQIALSGNNEVKISSGKDIRLIATGSFEALKDIAVQALKATRTM